MNKKKAYFGILLVPEGVVVKESGAAIVFTDRQGKEHTSQIPLFKIVGTSEEIASQTAQGIQTALRAVDELLKKESVLNTFDECLKNDNA